MPLEGLTGIRVSCQLVGSIIANICICISGFNKILVMPNLARPGLSSHYYCGGGGLISFLTLLATVKSFSTMLAVCG